MAGRTPIRGARAVTVRLNEEAYTNIKKFAAYSPSGLTAADFIRALVQTFGDYCKEQLSHGRVANSYDMGLLKGMVISTLSKDPKPESDNGD